MAQSKNLDKSDSEAYKATHLDTSNAHKEEPTDHIKKKLGLQAKEIDVRKYALYKILHYNFTFSTIP